MTDSTIVRTRAGFLMRPISAGVILMAVYVALSFAMSPDGYLGTDTGAKVATLDVMEQRGTARPGLGYWAEDLDPDGTLHPIYGSFNVEGDWVHVTTLPMLELGRPLWNLGGYRLALLLPMAGAVGAAFASRSLVRRSTDESLGWLTFWFVGLASPIAIYALDFWEHAPGVACIVGSVALLAGVVEGAPVPARALGAGVLLGTAASMRTESFVYAFVAVAACCLALVLLRRRWADVLALGALAVMGFAIPWALNGALERWLGGTSRGDRVSGTAAEAASQLGDRGHEAIVTLFALRSGSNAAALVLGGLAALAVAGSIVFDRRGNVRAARWVLAVAFVLHLSALAGGLAFVPGLFSAAPVAVGALVVLPTGPPARYSLAVAVGALPLVWAFQYVGGANPQWGGRYALSSCIILVALGVAALQQVGSTVRWGIMALSVLVSLTGLLWIRERSHSVADLFATLVDRPEDVVIARNGFIIREGGTAYSQRLWLTAVGPQDLERAADLVDRAGLDTFAVLDDDQRAPGQVGDASLVETIPLSVIGESLYLHSYAL